MESNVEWMTGEDRQWLAYAQEIPDVSHIPLHRVPSWVKEVLDLKTNKKKNHRKKIQPPLHLKKEPTTICNYFIKITVCYSVTRGWTEPIDQSAHRNILKYLTRVVYKNEDAKKVMLMSPCKTMLVSQGGNRKRMDQVKRKIGVVPIHCCHGSAPEDL